ncbi:MAG TPA: SLC13 family permease [Stellaceae bacterium]|nr:SLC13 family permease [Stellaceae bacterium]
MTSSRISRYLPIVVLAAVIAALWLVPGGDPGTKRVIDAALLAGFAIACWAFGWLAEPATTFVFFLLVVVFRVAKPEVVFSGFTSSAWWLVLGGSITAIAVQTTGLGRRLAALLLGRAAGSYPRAVATVALAAVGLAFLMPSTSGRILLLMPIVLAFAERLGLAPGRPGYVGLVLTVAAASYMPPTTILPANVPNSILLGAAESLYGVRLAYGPYLILHFPILGALKTAALIGTVCWLFPEGERLRPAPAEDLGPMSREERRLAWLLALSLLLFATDFIHGVSPAWISLGTGVLCFLPPFGLITPEVFSARINVVMLVYIAGILGLGAVVADSGLSAAVSARLLTWASLAPGHIVGNVATLSAIGAGLAAITTVTGVPAVLTPLAQEFASASGLPLLTVLMLQVVVFSTVFLPFESPPMMVSLHLGRVGLWPASKLCLALSAVTILVLLPLDYLWWEQLGYLP